MLVNKNHSQLGDEMTPYCHTLYGMLLKSDCGKDIQQLSGDWYRGDQVEQLKEALDVLGRVLDKLEQK